MMGRAIPLMTVMPDSKREREPWSRAIRQPALRLKPQPSPCLPGRPQNVARSPLAFKSTNTDASSQLATPPAYSMRILGAALLLLSSTTLAAAAPNIVVIMTDDQEDMGSMAYMPKTHALLAEHGLTFTNSFVNLSLCCPSRASFLTGQSAHNHGIKSNSPVDGGGWEAFKDKEANALPVWLKAKGYKTAMIGKYLNRYGQQSTFGSWLGFIGEHLNIDIKSPYVGNPPGWVPPGWDLWYAVTGSRVKYFDYAINENGTIRNFDHAPGDYSTDVFKDRAVRFIADEAKAADPFFMLIATKAVHTQGKTALPAPKYQHALSDVTLPTGPAFNEQNVSGKGLRYPRLTEEDKANLDHELSRDAPGPPIGGRSRRGRGRCVGSGRQARRYGHHLHLRQRLPVRRPPPRRQSCPL